MEMTHKGTTNFTHYTRASHEVRSFLDSIKMPDIFFIPVRVDAHTLWGTVNGGKERPKMQGNYQEKWQPMPGASTG